MPAGVSVVLLAAVVGVVLQHAGAPELSRSLDSLPMSAIVVAFAALAGGAILATVRLRLVARDLGYPLNWRDALSALGLGQLGGALFFQIAGQLAARGAFLSRRGLPVGATVLMVGYERLAGLVVSLVLASIGAWHVFGRITLDIGGGGDELIKLAAAATLAVIGGSWLGWGRETLRTRAVLVNAQLVRRVLRTTLISLMIQAMTAGAYVALVHQMAPTIPVFDLVAASFVVMFAAALPFSFAGWGVRELSAVVVLGTVGVPAGDALVAAAAIGVASLLVVVPLAGMSLTGQRQSFQVPPGVPTANAFDYSKLVALSVPLIVATGVFFHAHLPTDAGGLNVNLADPFALLGGALLLILVVWRERTLPDWRLPGFNLHVALATLVMTAALLIGATRFGWTDWALTNKFAGWFVLLAYGATGALITAREGTDGGRLLLSTFVAAGVAVATIELLLQTLRGVGVDISPRVLWYDATGFAANRNAYAFQMLMVSVAAIVVHMRDRATVLVLISTIASLWFAGSRSGWISGALLLGLAYALGALSRRQVLAALLGGAALAATIEYSWLVQLLYRESDTVLAAIAAQQSALVVSASAVAERFASYIGAWNLFREYPLFGAGLGAHIEHTLRETGIPLVIHSTTAWIVAEMGLLGLLVFVTPMVRLFRREFARASADPAALLIVLLIAVFATMSLVHEMLYQRTFWLLLGAGLAWHAIPRPGSRRDES